MDPLPLPLPMGTTKPMVPGGRSDEPHRGLCLATASAASDRPEMGTSQDYDPILKLL